MRENDVLIYAIGVFESAGGRCAPRKKRAVPGLLNDLCEQTGGRHLPADVAELPDIAAKIGVELRNRYVLGYSPVSQPRDGRYHTLQVKVVPPKGLPVAAAVLPPRLLRAHAVRRSGDRHYFPARNFPANVVSIGVEVEAMTTTDRTGR